MQDRTKDVRPEVLYQILDQLHEAIYLINKDGIIIYVNKEATRLERLDYNQMIGKSISEVYSFTDMEEKNAPSLNVLRSGVAQVDENIEWFTKDGVMVNAITSSYPLFCGDKNGEKPTGVYSISSDIGNLKKRLRCIGAFDRKDTYRLRKPLMRNGTFYIFDDIVYTSEIMRETITMAKRFAAKKMPIMIYGETGTGKEMIAQSIHNASPFLASQFVAINCAAIPENLLESLLFGTVKGAFTGATDSAGLFEKAENGTIFLDEINSMPVVLQAKILRALQEKEIRRIGDNKTRKINCRIISATNKLPMDAIRDGELREDLFYRLSTGMIFVPPLRERGRDLGLLIHYFIEKSNDELDTSIERVSESLSALLRSYHWPGNIRELSNIIESTMNMTREEETVLDVHHLPNYLKSHFYEEISAMPNALQVFTIQNNISYRDRRNHFPVMNFHGDLSQMLGEYEKNILETALASTSGNLTRCGEKLGITRQGLMKKVKKYGIHLDRFKRKT